MISQGNNRVLKPINPFTGPRFLKLYGNRLIILCLGEVVFPNLIRVYPRYEFIEHYPPAENLRQC